MRPFTVVAAQDAQHAVALLAEHAGAAKLLAGGTDLVVELKAGVHSPQVVIDLTRARDMKGIAVTDAGLVIGALATHSDIMRSHAVREHCPALADAAHTVGAVQTRNLGTLGGNLVSGVPSMDGGPTLVALDARAVIAGPAGRRELPLAEFWPGPRRTALAPGELLVAVVVPRASLGRPAAFVKFGLRKGQALALVNAAASFVVDAAGAFAEPRIALGAVAPTVIRAPLAEAHLAGRKVTVEAMAEAGRIAAGEARPISDFRATADYRGELVAVLTRRALEDAWARVRGKVS
jgi:carbon-monoxide dehydrogenase medium subunit